MNAAPQTGRGVIHQTQRELLWHGARTWRTRRGDPISFVVLVAGFALAAWALFVDSSTDWSGYILYFGAGSATSLLAVRVAYWLVTSAQVRRVVVDLKQSPSGTVAWVRGAFLPVHVASLAVMAPAIAWVVFNNPSYLHGYRGLLFVALWAGFIVSAILDPILAFALISRADRPRLRSMLVALGLSFLKPFPVMWLLDEVFRLGRGDGGEIIIAGFLIVNAHLWLLYKSHRWMDVLVDEWADRVEG